MPQSLYERIGGEPAVRATVVKMYDKILNDPSLAPFFEHIDVQKLRLSQTAFVTYAFGGPNHYKGKSLNHAHQGAVKSGLDDKHFDRVAVHLSDAMKELNVPQPLIDEVMGIVGGTRESVLGRATG